MRPMKPQAVCIGILNGEGRGEGQEGGGFYLHRRPPLYPPPFPLPPPHCPVYNNGDLGYRGHWSSWGQGRAPPTLSHPHCPLGNPRACLYMAPSSPSRPTVADLACPGRAPPVQLKSKPLAPWDRRHLPFEKAEDGAALADPLRHSLAIWARPPPLWATGRARVRLCKRARGFTPSPPLPRSAPLQASLRKAQTPLRAASAAPAPAPPAPKPHTRAWFRASG